MQSEVRDKEAVKAHVAHKWVENGHIFLWLIKDACWALVWKPGGLFMIFPTLSVAFYILWQSRHNRSELFHNLAICLWITANSVWMTTEFFNIDKEYKKYAVVFFVAGIIVLLVYYLFYFRKDRRKEREHSSI